MKKSANIKIFIYFYIFNSLSILPIYSMQQNNGQINNIQNAGNIRTRINNARHVSIPFLRDATIFYSGSLSASPIKIAPESGNN